MKMREFIEGVIVKVVILAGVVLVGYWIHLGVEQLGDRREMKLRKEYNFTHEISPITRSLNHKIDTVKADTLKR